MRGTPLRKPHSGNDGRSKLLNGVNELANTVASTLGAAGRTVIMEDPLGNPKVTKDGVTVAEYVNPYEPVANLGASLIRQAAKKTADEAGDGTTTSVVLAKAILDQAIPTVNKSNFRELIEGIKKGRDKVIKELQNKTTEVTESNLADIATISANGDPELGAMISEAYGLVGLDGTVTIGNSDTNKTYVRTAEGSSIDRGYVSSAFVNDGKNKCTLNDAKILLLDTKVSNIWHIQDLLEGALKGASSLLIIGELEQQAIATLAMNKIKSGFKVCVIEPPLFGQQRHKVMEDLGLLTGATVIGEEHGNALNTAGFTDLGSVKKVTVESGRTIFKFDDSINKDVRGERLSDLHEFIKSDAVKADRNMAKFRINILTGKIAEIKVGADTEVELEELRDRVDDSVHATRCALQEGIVHGGGVALKDISNKLMKDAKSDGEKMLYASLQAPLNQILKNAGLKPSDFPLEKVNHGVDVVTGKLVNTKSKGIIDPVKVTKNAVINATSVATTILSTDYVLTNIRANDEDFS